MCGIITVYRKDKKNASKMVSKRYYKQKSRGSEGFGFLAVDSNHKIAELVRSEGEKKIIDALSKNESPVILFHHRRPTSTPNLEDATHPIKVSHESLEYDYYVVHNGIISNDDELKKGHDDLGFKYTTLIQKKYITSQNEYTYEMYNDSEALAIELAQCIDGKKDTVDAIGSIAFVVFQVSKEDQKLENIYFGRNLSNPLKMHNKGEFFVLSSEGEGESIDHNKLYRYSIAEQKCFERELTFKTYTSHYVGTGYSYRDYHYGSSVNNVNSGSRAGFHWNDPVQLPLSQSLEDKEDKDEENDFQFAYDDALAELYEAEYQLHDEIDYLEELYKSNGNEEVEADLILKREQLTAIEKSIDEMEAVQTEEMLLREGKAMDTMDYFDEKGRVILLPTMPTEPRQVSDDF